MAETIQESLVNLLNYCENTDYKGYDPYDTLNSAYINFKLFGKWGPPVAIQIQKRNPFNIRWLLGIKKETNPKAMGLFLKAYSVLYNKTGEEKYLQKAKIIFDWLKDNYSTGYSGKCWGYNFDWASPGSYLKAYTPSVVVTSFVVDGIFEYALITKDNSAKELILSSAKYIRDNIPVTKFEEGICFSYTHNSIDCCYNANLLAVEVLAKAGYFEKNPEDSILIKQAIAFVLSKQKPDGSWNYSYDPAKDKEREQIDFHQGFILMSLHNLLVLTESLTEEIEYSIRRGLQFYRVRQFSDSGISYWKLPSKLPVDIHFQSQGIITFSSLSRYNTEYSEFARKIAFWTIKNMQSKRGYFYYRIGHVFKNRIPFLRWGQAWMMLALAILLESKNGAQEE